MLIYEALEKDHTVVKQLLTTLISLPDDDEDQRDLLVHKIRDELVPHSRAEEAIFYNSLREADVAKGMALHGYKEHMEAETLLRLLQVKNDVNMNWRVTAQKLKDALEHHIQEEENEIFQLARSCFTDEEATQMCEAFEKMKPEVREEGFMGTTIDMISNMMPHRFSNAVRTNTSHQ